MNERKKHRSGNIKYKTSREELKEFPYNGSFVLMGKMSEKRGGEGRIRIRQNGRRGARRWSLTNDPLGIGYIFHRGFEKAGCDT